MNIEWVGSPNYWQGRQGYKPEAIVIHLAGGTLQGCKSWFNNIPSYSEVSSHYIVGKNREVCQFVNDEDTAWHAGGVANPSWNSLKININPNLYTIGIEHEGYSPNDISGDEYDESTWLTASLCKKHNIPCDREHIIGHYQINSVSRAGCPGIDMDQYVRDVQTKLDQLLPKPEDNLYKVKKDGVQLGAFKEVENALDEYIDLEANEVTQNNLNLTDQFIAMANKLEIQINELQIKLNELTKLNSDQAIALDQKDTLITSLQNEVHKLQKQTSLKTTSKNFNLLIYIYEAIKSFFSKN